MLSFFNNIIKNKYFIILPTNLTHKYLIYLCKFILIMSLKSLILNICLKRKRLKNNNTINYPIHINVFPYF